MGGCQGKPVGPLTATPEKLPQATAPSSSSSAASQGRPAGGGKAPATPNTSGGGAAGASSQPPAARSPRDEQPNKSITFSTPRSVSELSSKVGSKASDVAVVGDQVETFALEHRVSGISEYVLPEPEPARSASSGSMRNGAGPRSGSLLGEDPPGRRPSGLAAGSGVSLSPLRASGGLMAPEASHPSGSRQAQAPPARTCTGGSVGSGVEQPIPTLDDETDEEEREQRRREAALPPNCVARGSEAGGSASGGSPPRLPYGHTSAPKRCSFVGTPLHQELEEKRQAELAAQQRGGEQPLAPPKTVLEYIPTPVRKQSTLVALQAPPVPPPLPVSQAVLVPKASLVGRGARASAAGDSPPPAAPAAAPALHPVTLDYMPQKALPPAARSRAASQADNLVLILQPPPDQAANVSPTAPGAFPGSSPASFVGSSPASVSGPGPSRLVLGGGSTTAQQSLLGPPVAGSKRFSEGFSGGAPAAIMARPSASGPSASSRLGVVREESGRLMMAAEGSGAGRA